LEGGDKGERFLSVSTFPLPLFSLCLCFLCLTDGWAEEGTQQGLVALYRLDEGDGSVCHDGSGNRHDGKIRGALWVKGQKGVALDFDGIDDYVDCGDSEKLRVEGALTLTVWLNTTSRAQQYVISRFGWNIYLSGGDGVPCFETLLASRHGWDTLPASQPVPLGKWTFIVATFNPQTKRMAIYINGSLSNTKERSEVGFGGLRRSKLMIGRWTAGDSRFYFDGLIGEVRIYGRELSESEIHQLYQEGLKRYDDSLSSPPFRISLSPHLFFVAQKVIADLFVRARKPIGEGLSVRVQLLSTGKNVKPLREETKVLTASTRSEVTFSLANLSPSEYALSATLFGEKGRKLAEETARFIFPKKPWWLGSKEGVSKKVLPPWTPLKARLLPSSLEVSCWGRTYRFGALPFLAAIETAGRSILASPMRVKAKADGKEQIWSGGKVQLLSQSPESVSLSQQANGDTLVLSAKTTVEYDGMMRVDFEVKSHRRTRLEELVLEIPLRAEYAKYLYYYPDRSAPWEAHRPGALPREGKVMSFNPCLWLGDEEGGLEWFCESDKNWFNADPKRAIEVVPEGNAVTLRLHLVSAPVMMETSTLSYTFGFQATPVKPIEKDAWDYRIT